MLDSGAEGPGFKSQPRRCRVTVLGKLFTPIMPLFIKQRNWYRPTPGLTAKNRDQLRNPTLGNRVWATFTSLCNRWGLGSPQEKGNFLEGASPGPFKLGDIWRELKLLARWRRRGAPDFRSCIATASNLPAVILTIIWYSITHSLFSF